MKFRVAHWDILDDKSCNLVSKGKKKFSALMVILMYLYFSMQEEDIMKHTNAKCHLWTIV
jgi:hypothetical protein